MRVCQTPVAAFEPRQTSVGERELLSFPKLSIKDFRVVRETGSPLRALAEVGVVLHLDLGTNSVQRGFGLEEA